MLLLIEMSVQTENIQLWLTEHIVQQRIWLELKKEKEKKEEKYPQWDNTIISTVLHHVNRSLLYILLEDVG